MFEKFFINPHKEIKSTTLATQKLPSLNEISMKEKNYHFRNILDP